MGLDHPPTEHSRTWGPEARALAAQSQVLSGIKLDQLVRRLQRQTGQSREACWRFVIQHGLKGRAEYRRWPEEEIEEVREELVKHSVEEVARKLKRSAKAIRCMLHRNNLTVRDIRCDCFSVEALADVLRIRKTEILHWIEQKWLQPTIRTMGKKQFYTISPEAFLLLYKHHLHDLLDQRRVPNLAMFEAFYQYCYTPKHTVGEQLLDVRRDKRERAAYAALQTNEGNEEEDDDEDGKDDFNGEACKEFAED